MEAAGTSETSIPIDLLQGATSQTTFHLDTHYNLGLAHCTLKRTVMKEEWLIWRVSRDAAFGLHQAYCWYSLKHFTRNTLHAVQWIAGHDQTVTSAHVLEAPNGFRPVCKSSSRSPQRTVTYFAHARIHTHRIVLEHLWERNSILTSSYSDQHLPLFRRNLWCFSTNSLLTRISISASEITPCFSHWASGHDMSYAPSWISNWTYDFMHWNQREKFD